MTRRQPPDAASAVGAASPDQLRGLPLTRGLLASALRIAERAVVSDIECEGILHRDVGPRVYDVRPLLDEREHSPELIDQAREALGWALARRVIEIVPGRPWHTRRLPWLVRIVAPLASEQHDIEAMAGSAPR